MATQFNTEIKNLFNLFKDLPSSFKGKVYIKEFQNKMNVGMRTEPQYAMVALGPLVWRSRKEIAELNAEFFLNKRADRELVTLCSQHKVNYDDAIGTIDFMKCAYREATADQQSQIFKILQKLVSIYAQQEIANRGSLN